MYMQVQRESAQTRFTKKLTDEQNRLRQVGEQLTSELQSAGEEAVMKARPAMVKVMGKASPEWRKLVQESLDEAGDVEITVNEITEELAKKFGQNSPLTQKALDDLGVSVMGQSEPALGGGVGTTVRPFSAKEIFRKLNEQRLDIPFQKRAGVSLYGENEFYKDSLVESLTNILNRKGVDFSRANQFWAPYAQLRNSLFKQIKPFLREPFQTEGGSRLLQKAATGKGKMAEIADLEARSGTDLTSRLKDIQTRLGETKSASKALSKQVQAEKRKFMGELTRKELEATGKAADISRKKKIALGAGALGLSALGVKLVPSLIRREGER